jgi:hypothetical protein
MATWSFAEDIVEIEYEGTESRESMPASTTNQAIEAEVQ